MLQINCCGSNKRETRKKDVSCFVLSAEKLPFEKRQKTKKEEKQKKEVTSLTFCQSIGNLDLKKPTVEIKRIR